MRTCTPVRQPISPYSTKAENAYNSTICGDTDKSSTNMDQLYKFWTYNAALLKNLTGDIQRKVIWVHHSFNKSQISWELHREKLPISSLPKRNAACSNEPKFSKIHSLRKCTKITGECSTYQLSIKLIRDENPFDIQANVFCLGTQHIFCIEGSHARNKEQAPKLNLSLYIVPSHLLVTPKRYFMQGTWSYIQIFVI